MDGAVIGRIVHYVAADGEWPAIITRVWPDQVVDLVIFGHGGIGSQFLGQVPYVVDEGRHATWHWPGDYLWRAPSVTPPGSPPEP